MNVTEERRTFYASVRVELEDVTAEEAREFWRKLGEHEIEIGGYAAAVLAVEPKPPPSIFPADSPEDSRRYHGD